MKNNKLALVVMMTGCVCLFSCYLGLMVPQLASQFGITQYAAQKIINIAAAGGSVWGIIAVVGGTAGWGAVILAAAKGLIKRYGATAAAAW